MQRIRLNDESLNIKNSLNKKTRPISEYRSLNNLHKNKTTSTFPKINNNLEVSVYYKSFFNHRIH
jgi:hypothetical protein